MGRYTEQKNPPITQAPAPPPGWHRERDRFVTASDQPRFTLRAVPATYDPETDQILYEAYGPVTSCGERFRGPAGFPQSVFEEALEELDKARERREKNLEEYDQVVDHLAASGWNMDSFIAPEASA